MGGSFSREACVHISWVGTEGETCDLVGGLSLRGLPSLEAGGVPVVWQKSVLMPS